MGSGALKAIKRAGRQGINIIGVDALLQEGAGVDLVRKGEFLATHLYPTGGSEAILLAKKILQGEPFERFTELPTAMVDSTNARVMQLQYQSMKAQDEKFLQLESLTARQLEKINQQRLVMWISVLLVIVCCVTLVLTWKFYKEKAQVNELMMAQLKTLVSQTAATVPEVAEPATEPEAEEKKEESQADVKLLNRISQIVNEHISDTNFTINTIADELRISRTQLYRRIKSMSDTNLNDLIRKTRLEHARHLLATTDKSVSEVAYEVGFSAPSYFAKCYKDYFGNSPSSHAKS